MSDEKEIAEALKAYANTELDVGRLRIALLRSGVHRHHCATSLTPPQGGAVPVCNCGYHDALAPDTEGE